MKLTDLSLIFLIIILPIFAMVYINVSYVSKTIKEEMYYESLISLATSDATDAMKQVESQDLDIDYGYSGIVDNKISINADVAISTFYNSLFKNFGILGNKDSEEKLKAYIPVVSIMDYDGIYIHSAETFEDGKIKYVTKPKKYFTDMFCIVKNASNTEFEIKDLKEVENIDTDEKVVKRIYQINYTMDDYITFKVYNINNDLLYNSSFYIDEFNNPNIIVASNIIDIVEEGILSENLPKITEAIKNHAKENRKVKIGQIAMQEITYAVNFHNTFAKEAGIQYNFAIETMSDETFYEKIDGIGMIAVVQGISLGNRKLNYISYGVTDLTITKKYFLSEPIIRDPADGLQTTYLGKKLYHISEECPVYKEYKLKHLNEWYLLKSKFLISKNEAAANGYYPCPICNP